MSLSRLAIGTTLAASALVVLGPAAPALAFHHVVLPAPGCSPAPFAGGSNPTARTALLQAGHTLPLPPAGTPGAGQADAQCPGK